MSALDTQQVIARLKAENARLRADLGEMLARYAASPTGFLLADATQAARPALHCRHVSIPGRVTVVIPAYNAASFVERAIRSVWTQSLQADDIEVLVIDDGSSDDTAAICRRLSESSPVRMRVLQHGQGRNLGVSATRQLGCAEATGEFVALLDADDLYLPDRLRIGVAALQASEQTAAVCSLGVNVDQAGNPVIGHNGTRVAGDWIALDEDLAPPFGFEQLWIADPIANSSLTIRRSALEAVGGYPELMAHQAEDWLLVLKLSLLSPIPCIEQQLMHYTHHEQAYTTQYNRHGLHEGARIEVFYHLVWWMLHSTEHAELGATFFRREYPRLIADHQRLLPVLRNYLELGGHAADGLAGVDDYVHRLYQESMALHRVLDAKSKENRLMRDLLADGADTVDQRVASLHEELMAMRRVLAIKTDENRALRSALKDRDRVGTKDA